MTINEEISNLYYIIISYISHLDPNDPCNLGFCQYILSETFSDFHKGKKYLFKTYDEIYGVISNCCKYSKRKALSAGFLKFELINRLNPKNIYWSIPNNIMEGFSLTSLIVCKQHQLPSSKELFLFMKKIENYEPSIIIIILNYVIDFISDRYDKEYDYNKNYVKPFILKWIYIPYKSTRFINKKYHDIQSYKTSLSIKNKIKY